MEKAFKGYYYALVWNTALDEKDLVIQGQLITKNTILPEGPHMMYGTNPNDILKVRTEKIKEKIEYDVLTMKQSVKFIREVEEIDIPRDVRILVWEGSDKINLKESDYKIVSPQMFQELIEMSEDCLEDEDEIMRPSILPEVKFNKNILNMLDLNLSL